MTGLTLRAMPRDRLMEPRLVCARGAAKGASLRHIAGHRTLNKAPVCVHCEEPIVWDATVTQWSRFTIFEEPW